MAAIARSLKERVEAMRPIDVGRGGSGQAIVGESNYQVALEHLKRNAFIAVGETPIATFFLAREPENPYDRDAIRCRWIMATS